jgi:SAM-dependent methyltransferase
MLPEEERCGPDGLHMDKSLLSNYAHYYEAASFLLQQRDKEEVERFARIVASGGRNLAIMDVGCAEGELSVLLARQGHKVTAADISPSFLDQTKRRAAENGVVVSTVLLDVEQQPRPELENSFDVIYLMDVIEHLRCPAQGLVTLRAMLHEKGTLVIHTPNLASLGQVYRYVKFRKKRENYFSPRNLGDLHLQGYDYQTLEKALNFAGLKIRDVLPTVVSLPVLYKFAWARPLSRWLSRVFPLISDTLLATCEKTPPIDLEKQIEFWKQTHV